jgi:hypothetical protein
MTDLVRDPLTDLKSPFTSEKKLFGRACRTRRIWSHCA